MEQTAKAHLLVVDDEEKIRALIRKYAEFEGYRISEAAGGMEAVLAVRKQDFDLVILDIMMPELDGFAACREIKKEKDIPVLMLSARGEEYDKLLGFELLADDYVVKPFSPRELLMRVAAILRRVGKSPLPRELLSFEGLAVDAAGRIVYVDGQRLELSPKVYDLLWYLIDNRGIALTREQLISAVWGYDFFGDDRTLDTHIKLLRNSLGPYRRFIVTLRGVGYRFDG
jgi:DNA-binding response OmpR family regulator